MGKTEKKRERDVGLTGAIPLMRQAFQEFSTWNSLWGILKDLRESELELSSGAKKHSFGRLDFCRFFIDTQRALSEPQCVRFGC
jgi:hypothetical protein